MKNCHLKVSSSYGIWLVIIKEFETESVIKGYHAYMNDWTLILGENLSSRPEPEIEIDKYAVGVAKGARVIGAQFPAQFYLREKTNILKF